MPLEVVREFEPHPILACHRCGRSLPDRALQIIDDTATCPKCGHRQTLSSFETDPPHNVSVIREGEDGGRKLMAHPRQEPWNWSLWLGVFAWLAWMIAGSPSSVRPWVSVSILLLPAVVLAVALRRYAVVLSPDGVGEIAMLVGPFVRLRQFDPRTVREVRLVYRPSQKRARRFVRIETAVRQIEFGEALDEDQMDYIARWLAEHCGPGSTP